MAADRLEAGDLARLREIAEEGRQRPLLGGPSLIIWGCAIAAASLLHWAIMRDLISIPAWSVSAMWFGLMFGAALLAGVFQSRSASDPASLSTANRVSRAVWQMAGAFLATLSIGLVAHATLGSQVRGNSAWLLLSVMPPATFGVYGIALAATAVSGEARWLMRYAWGSLAFTVATAYLVGSEAQFAVQAIGAVAVSVMPGLRMLRHPHDG